MNVNSIGITGENVSEIKSANKTKFESESFSKSLDEAIINGRDEELKEACQQFESYFLNMMFKSMRSTVVSGGGIFEKSNAETIFQEMLDEEMAKNISSSTGIGIADMMYEQMNSVDYKG